MLRKNYTIHNRSKEIIRLDMRYREDARNAPVVIICHGFKGFKDWGFFPHLSETLADAGYIAITFNFSRNGIGADPQNFTELDLFARNTYSHELDDLKCVLSSVREGILGKGLIDPDNIGLFGHSRGGGIALLGASAKIGIRAIVTWAAISHVNRFGPDQIMKWKTEGFIEIENKRTGQLMRIDSDLLEDINRNADHLDIIAAAKRLVMPILIIHGEKDDTVPLGEAEAIYKSLSSEDKDYIVIEGANHTMGITHPMTARTPAYETALDLTENWFDLHLNS
jgi:dienelactone hydrolase